MKSPKVSIIVAVAGAKRVIGKKGDMPWHITEELKRFREITLGHPIIMGRKTHESIGKALPGRTNIIVTRDPSYEADGCITVNSLDKALEVAQGRVGGAEVFIIGGGEIYRQALPITDKLYLTVIDKKIEGDTFFPDYSEFKKVVSESYWQQSGDFKYKLLELER